MSGPLLPDAELAALRMRKIARAYDQLRAASDKLLGAQRRGASPLETVPLMQALVLATINLRVAAFDSLVAYGLSDDMTFPSVVEGEAKEEINSE